MKPYERAYPCKYCKKSIYYRRVAHSRVRKPYEVRTDQPHQCQKLKDVKNDSKPV